MLSMVLLGTMTVLVVGGAAIGDSRQNVQVSQAEHAMRQLDAGASTVAFENSDRALVDLGLSAGDGQLWTTDDGWMRVEIQDADTDYADPETRVLNVTLGTAIYQSGETTVAYQGGGVWRSDGDAATMVARPEFHYRNGTLTIPVVNITESNDLYGEVEVVETGSFERWYPNVTDGRPHKLDNAKIIVTVQSDYYEAWGQYFEDETDGIVTYDHAQETVSVKFLALPSTFSIQNGIVATSGTGTFELAGTGSYTDSYNSSNGSYATTKGKNGDVAAVGGVILGGNSSIQGDLYVGETIDTNGGPLLDGNAYVVDKAEFDAEKASFTHTGDVYEIPGVATIEPIDRFISNEVERIRTTNDNADHPGVIVDNSITIGEGDGPKELDAGQYYLTTISIDQSTLYLDTTGGDITIAVRDYIAMSSSNNAPYSRIIVNGTGNVTVYMLSEAESKVDGKEGNFLMGKGSTVYVDNESSPQFRVYGPSAFNASIQASSAASPVFVGVIYAPAGTDGTGSVVVSHAEVFGAVVSGTLVVNQGGAVHYDEALGMIDIPRSPTVSRLEYLHIGHHKIAIREV